MHVQTLDGLRLITQVPINLDNAGMFIIGCSPEMVNLNFGEPKQLRVKSCGVWTHSLFGWVGPMTNALKAFTKTLPKHTHVISLPHVNIWLLKNNHAYGTLAISALITKGGHCEVLNNLDNEEIIKLDRAASTYRYSGKAEAALKILFGIYDSVNLLDNTESAINARSIIYDSFTLPFTENPDKEGEKYEALLAKCFDVSNKFYLRQFFAEGYQFAVQLEKLYGH